ncbi:hypothetical protein ACFYY8_28530 [Streptosporangium sp. NPDC001559]|uniref:hypothetical protein n=1 Tax=Streptosporangium sp. NPDC001559 TaxID=3366187 RepID=UPI0036EE7203
MPPLGATAVVFLTVRSVPGDPVTAFLRPSEPVVSRREEFGPVTQDAPWPSAADDRDPRVPSPWTRGFVRPRSWFPDLTAVTVTG